VTGGEQISKSEKFVSPNARPRLRLGVG
jgi:hypothetical protein